MPRRIVALFRAARIALHIGYGLTLATIYPWLNANLRRRILQNWSAGLLDIFNVKVLVAADAPLHGLRHGLIVTNHISWLDVFVLNTVVPMRFVAKAEVRHWPLIGWLCARAQTLFIERGKARDAARLNVHLVQSLRSGECFAIFPEGTTTDGSAVGHFHASLFQPAIDAAAAVLPVAIRYQDAQGRISTTAAYIDEVSFGSSMWAILCAPALQVRLLTTPALNASAQDRRSLSQAAQRSIADALGTADSSNIHPALTRVQHAHANLRASSSQESTHVRTNPTTDCQDRAPAYFQPGA
ncbi:lysophospholipid acyltransferase family protein [Ferrigenium sp. UT5]|uniref:lysophospholipid acyltransferase family protein n=1 Tax=Ferrigenium sp. UT5 TaxID=3242105 RepID=UPI003552594D